MSKTRHKGELANVHIRLPEKQYERVKLIAKKLSLSVAECIDRMLEVHGVERLYKEAKKIKRDPVPVRIIFGDDETKKLVGDLTEAINTEAEQLRHIGANLSNCIRFIRGAGYDARRDWKLLNDLSHIEDEINSIRNDNTANARKLYDKLFSDESRVFIDWGEEDVFMDQIDDGCDPFDTVSDDR